MESTHESNMPFFSVLKDSVSSYAPRLGVLSLQSRSSIATPHYLAITSRGGVPHISQDNFRRHMKVQLSYVPLEDFIEKDAPPILDGSYDDNCSRLRKFISLESFDPIMLAPRRVPAVSLPASARNSVANAVDSISILTSVGFAPLPVLSYIQMAKSLQPDFLVGIADIPWGHEPGRSRREKMVERTLQWNSRLLQEFHTEPSPDDNVSHRTKTFAPILPIDLEVQRSYLQTLVDMKEMVHGLAFYDTNLELDLPPELEAVPRLSLDCAQSPSAVLKQISRGIDMFAIPFVGQATDAGVALDFDFPASILGDSDIVRRALGIDMWSVEHSVDRQPLNSRCNCYCCRNFHRAYIRHLLDAKEMLGWVLLQIHNHSVMDAFFAGIRASIEQGNFERDRDAFDRSYMHILPEKTGQGPRVRGYQYKSEGPNEKKKNKSPFNSLDTSAESGSVVSPPSTPEGDFIGVKIVR